MEKEKGYKLVFSDNGIGNSKDFDWRNSESLGLKLIVLLVENQLDGTINVENEGGSTFFITFGHLATQELA